MAKLWAIIKREYLERVRSKWFLIATFFGPIFFGAIIIVPAWLASRSKATTRRLQHHDSRRDRHWVRPPARDQHCGRHAPTRRRCRRCTVVAPSELTQRREHGDARRDAEGENGLHRRRISRRSPAKPRATPGRNATSIADMAQMQERDPRRRSSRQRLEKVGLDDAQMKEITFIPLDFSTERITERGRAGSGMASVLFGFAIGFLLYMSIVIYGQTIMSGVLEEKTTRVAEVVMSSVPTDTLLAGKVLGVGAVGLTQQIIWIATTYVLLKLRAPIMAKFGAPTMSFSLPDISLGCRRALPALLPARLHFLLVAVRGGRIIREQRAEARQAATPLLIMIVSTGVFIQPVLLNPTGTTAQGAVARADLVADHHADPNGGDRRAGSGAGRESRFSR